MQNRIDKVKDHGAVLRCRKGFTLTELMAVLVILAILTAIAIPSAAYYIKLAEFRKNEANAKTAYLAAESVLTWYRTSGEWETFRAEIMKGEQNNTFQGTGADSLNGRIYAVTLNSSSASSRSGTDQQLRTLLQDCGYDEDFLSGAIAVEVDVETGMVYSAFYATRCDALSYTGTDTDGVLDISAREGNRAYDSRKERLLGYYSAEDVANVVELKPVSLKVTSINLVNSETLSLNWSSNSRHNNEDVDFYITFYRDGDQKELFSTRINKAGLTKEGWSAGEGNQMAALELTREGTSIGTWHFPLYYLKGGSGQNGRFSLILDGMMSAALMENLKASSSEGLYQTSSTSITRLGTQINELREPQDIYAVIRAEHCYPENGTQEELLEYRESFPVKSNTENTLFAAAEESGTGTDTELKAELSRFRHLSNIRYFDEDKKAEFTLTAQSLDWKAAGVGLYEGAVDSGSPGNVLRPVWQASVTGEKVLDFPSIPLLSGNHSLTGEGKGGSIVSSSNALLLNLRLGKASVPSDAQIESLYGAEAGQHYAEYMGLFCEMEGTIGNMTLQDPVAELAGEGETEKDGLPKEAEEYKHMCGVGILCGRSQGTLKNIAVKVTDKNIRTVTVSLADREKNPEDVRDTNPAGIGGLVGVLALQKTDGSMEMLSGSGNLMEGLSMEGNIMAKLPVPQKVTEDPQGQADVEETAGVYSYGIGGIFGYARIGGNVKLKSCENHAGITGNLFVGGVGGRVDSDYAYKEDPDSIHPSGLEDCRSDGLILCARTASRKEQEAELCGRYFGGILGYGNQVEIYNSKSASGRLAGYQYMKDGYSSEEKESTLLGQYVGGIIGYGNSCHLKGCETERGGYILGSDYVGGIAGGLSNDLRQVITGAQEISVTTNAGYVIGNSYVGGIVGKNDGDEPTVVHNCVNNGVVAGYDFCIGGIVGYNGKKGVLENCASYLSDYDHSIYNTVTTKWNTTGDCAGGLAGYNNGTISFQDNQAVVIKSVTSIVTGRNFVGGIVGFQDTDGKIDAKYDLIGGQIHASGTGAGGIAGLNASLQLLSEPLTVTPVSVTGEYCTGGVIGANVVNLKENLRAGSLKARSGFARISGTAFTGGIIGFHRTYTEDQIPEPGLPDGKLAGGQSLPEGSGIFRYLLAAEGEALLPGLDEDSFPAKITASKNPYKLVIANDDNTESSLHDANNNIPIRGYAYLGGIVGFCERGSRLILQNCRNDAEIARLAEKGDGISLKKYLEKEGLKAAAGEIEGDPRVFMIGGIIGVNMENQIIDHCENRGNMRDFYGLGGIVGFNAGGVFNCGLDGNFGNEELDYIGGIAGLNVKAGESLEEMYPYEDVRGNSWTSSGTIGGCTAGGGRSVYGHDYVGGIAGFNLSGGVLKNNIGSASVTAAGDYAGGIAGYNAGMIEAAADDGTKRTVTGNNGIGIGGLVGLNRGSISVKGSNENNSDEVIAVGSGVNISGMEKVGGIVGINEGTLRAESDTGKTLYLTAEAEKVRALSGLAGGIAGEAKGEGGTISQARNRCVLVTADKEEAGGITAVNGNGMELQGCQNLGDVNSDSGHAGGIAAENQGRIVDCMTGFTEKPDKQNNITITSNGSDEIGAVCAVNTGEIIIGFKSPVGFCVELAGNARKAGGVAGVNEGTIQGDAATDTAAVEHLPGFSALTQGRLTVGGVAGENSGNGLIEKITAGGSEGLSFLDFSSYQYVGGIAGRNLSTVTIGEDGRPAAATAGIRNCKLTGGEFREKSSVAGNCYGGIAGSNSGAVTDCEVSAFRLSMTGIYTVIGTGSAEEKEASASHAGGIAGKNEKDAWIVRCFIGSGTSSGEFEVANGMAGGITGYNKGTVSLSGDAVTTEKLMKSDSGKELDADTLKSNAQASGFSPDSGYVNWKGDKLEDFVYNGSPNRTVFDGRDMTMILSNKGSLGGITAYNAPSGVVERCATGNWYLNNKSTDMDVGTGGIIGMNESEQDLSFLVNRAFVGRQYLTAGSRGATDRFAGGIIGNQNNTTVSGWKLQGCINYGMVYCMNAHYSGGILGQWTGTGGTIEKCVNYGNLQTTHNEGWKGAAAGIVAQLYHAYENNEYNIISCGNYGSIYTKDGITGNSCANDSAGILGNITAYRKDNVDEGQHYTIQVLDCVNGPGVEIYSGSMASGIVGFFSCDVGPNYDNILKSTSNIVLRIERCRNYAAVLKGLGGNDNNLCGGILGERYGQRGAGNTWLKNCYSVNRSSRYYSTNQGQNYPILFFYNYSNQLSSASSFLQAEDNYYLSEGNGTNDSTNNNITNGFVITRDTRIPAMNNILSRADTSRVYSVNIKGQQYIAYLRPTNSSLDIGNLSLNQDTIMQGKNEAGYVLFRVPDTYGTGTSMGTNIVNSDSDFDRYVRLSYHKLEDSSNLIQNGDSYKDQMQKPQGVSLTVDKERVTIQVTPAAGTDPFKYKGVLSLGGTVLKTLEFYSEEYTFYLSAQEAAQVNSGQLSVAVSACSMFDDVKDSEPVDKDGGTVQLLPAPEIRAELVRGGKDGLTYRFWLDNIEAYDVLKPEGSSGRIPADWKIQINGGKAEIQPVWDADAGKWVMASLYRDSSDLNSPNLQQLLAQAVGTGTNPALFPSEQVSVPVYLPSYTPSMPLKEREKEVYVKPEVKAEGDNLTNLSIIVTLTAQGTGSVTTPPVYRAELIGTWHDGQGKAWENAVLRSTHMLTSASGSVSAVFQDLPEYMSWLYEENGTLLPCVDNLRVRIWYAQPGLGRVQTYYSTENEYKNIYTLSGGQANIYELDEERTVKTSAEDGTVSMTPAWIMKDSPVLDSDVFKDYCVTLPSDGGNLLTWLPVPVLEETPVLATDTGADQNRMQYTFTWDKDSGAGNQYIVSLTGLTEKDGVVSEVSIVPGQRQTGNTMEVDAENWAYEKVKLTVTRVGDEEKKEIGLTASREYVVKQRLPRPAQPVVSNPNTNELDYTAEWTPISPETGCDSYKIWVQPYTDDGTPGNAVPVREVKTDTKDETGVYRTDLPLEYYAGQKVLIYLTAQPVPDDLFYVESVAGVTYELDVPDRIVCPSLTWSHTWDYDRNQPVTAASFRAEDETQGGSLGVAVKPAQAPPGDSSYLLKAYVFDSEEHAMEALKSDKNETMESTEGCLAVYPVQTEDVFAPVAMTPAGALEYLHTLRGLSAEYAGKWILFYARVSSGNGQIGSVWTENTEIWRLPFVKLASPEAGSGSLESEIPADNTTNPDIPLPETWTAVHKTAAFRSVELADTYYMTLIPRTDGNSSVQEQRYRFEETKTEDGETAVKVYAAEADGTTWSEISGTQEEDRYIFDLDGYSMEVSGKYSGVDGIDTYYTVRAGARLEVSREEGGGFLYTLILPDVYEMVPEEGIIITDENLESALPDQKQSLQPTDKVVFCSDVKENTESTGSDAYVRSEDSEVDY